MSNLIGSQPKVIPEFTGLQVNTAVQVLPIAIIYGSPRVNTNLIYYNGFNSQKVSTGSGKGPGSGKGQFQIEYFATIILAIGEGEIPEILIIYDDAQVYTPSNFPSNGAYYFGGSSTQAPWSYVTSNWPGDARPYKDTAIYCFSNAQLDSSATVPQINLVVKGLFAGSSPLNNSTIEITTGQYNPNGTPVSYIGPIGLGDADADPAQVIYDFLTNATYGATFPAAYIDGTSLNTSSNGYNPSIGDAALSTYCQAVGLAWSVVLNNVESANSILERWCKNLNVAPVWNGALLSFVPYWDSPASGNPGWDSGNGIALKYFTPYTTPIVAITIDQILQSESQDEDPITYTRKDPLEVYNTVRLDFRDRTNFFNDNPVEVKDEAHIELYGPRTDNIGLASEFTLLTYANVAASMQLRRNISIMLTYTWKMGPLWGWLQPMYIVNIPDPANYSNSITVRIISIEDDEEENCTITAENFPLGAQSPTIIPTAPTTPPNQGMTNTPPSPVYPPVLFAPTTAMLTATGYSVPQWIFGASGGDTSAYSGILDPNWGGCNIWVSLDNTSYQLLGTLNGVSTIGSLTQPLNGYSGSNPDNADPLYVNVNQCDGILDSVSVAVASSEYSICVIQDVSGYEILAYTTATLISPGIYELTGLYRGLYGTTSRTFNTGSQFMFVGTGGVFFETPLLPAYVGQTFWVKAQSFNSFRNATQDLADCVAYQYTATGPTPPPPVAPPMQIATYRRTGAKPPQVPTRHKNRRR